MAAQKCKKKKADFFLHFRMPITQGSQQSGKTWKIREKKRKPRKLRELCLKIRGTRENSGNFILK